MDDAQPHNRPVRARDLAELALIGGVGVGVALPLDTQGATAPIWGAALAPGLLAYALLPRWLARAWPLLLLAAALLLAAPAARWPWADGPVTALAWDGPDAVFVHARDRLYRADLRSRQRTLLARWPGPVQLTIHDVDPRGWWVVAQPAGRQRSLLIRRDVGGVHPYIGTPDGSASPERFAPDGQLFAGRASGRTVRWRSDSMAFPPREAVPPPPSTGATLQTPGACWFAPDGTLWTFPVWSTGTYAQPWSARTLEQLGLPRPAGALPVRGPALLTIDPEARHILDPATGARVPIAGPPGRPLDAALRSDGTLAIRTADAVLRVDRAGRVLDRLRIAPAAIDSTGRRLVTVGADGALVVRDVGGGATRRVVYRLPRWLAGLAWALAPLIVACGVCRARPGPAEPA